MLQWKKCGSARFVPRTIHRNLPTPQNSCTLIKVPLYSHSLFTLQRFALVFGPLGNNLISCHGSPRNSHMKWNLSLPKKGSSFPSVFLTQNHGAPKAPRSSAFCVLANSLSFHSLDSAAATISSTSLTLNRLRLVSSVCRTSEMVMLAHGGVQSSFISSCQACSKTAWGYVAFI